MGNPLRKVSLGAGMTGGGTALPIFNAFMVPYMKDKPRETFPSPPPMPPEIRALMERNKREELERLDNLTVSGARSEAITDETTTAEPSTTITGTGSAPAATSGSDGDLSTSKSGDEPPPVVKPILPKPQQKDPEPPKENIPEGTKRKGKKGDG